MNQNKTLLIAGCCFLIALGMAIVRDISIEKAGTHDLRNRVVGARLQKDGVSPYFYRWHTGENMRYYDSGNMGSTGPSNITASPFFHSLLYPIADLQQRTISSIWLALEYLFILVTGILAYRLAKNATQQITVLIAFALFLFTETWKFHIANGQMYLLLSLMAMIIYYCFTRRDQLTAAFIGGLATISLLLIRPNALVFFIPFLLLVKNYSRKYLVAFFVPVLLLPAIYFSFENNRIFWKDYSVAIPEVIKQHQGDPAEAKKLVKLATRPLRLTEFEGWNRNEMQKQQESNNYVMQSENGNVFVFYNYLFKRKMSTGLMSYLAGLSIIVLLALFYLISRKNDIITLPNIALLGYCLYMLVDVFSPIHRHQYYGVQWLFPLLIAAMVYTRANKWFYVALMGGVLLNVINTSYIKMEHSLGEYLILITLLWMSLNRKLEAQS